MDSIRIIETQDSPVLVVQPGKARLEDVERYLIMTTLRRTRYNRTKTARLLGIGIRTLQRKLKLYAAEKTANETIAQTSPAPLMAEPALAAAL